MAFTRREFLRRGMICGSAAVILPGAMLKGVYAAPGGSSKNLILIDLQGGNDGLNMVIPYGLDSGSYYSVFRPTLGVPQGQILPIAAGVGLNPGMTALKAHFDAGRLAVIPGVGYPDQDFSHEVATEIWAQGDPDRTLGTGWLGRTLGQFPMPPFPCAVDVASSVTRVLSGSGSFVPAFSSVSKMKYPTDPAHSSDKSARRVAYEAIANGVSGQPDTVGQMGKTVEGLLELVDTFAVLPQYTNVGTYPDGSMGKQLKMIARLLNADLGMRIFHVMLGGFDTHADQELDGYHTQRLNLVSENLGAFYADLVNLGIANDTVIVVYSEFGRTVYENGSSGTDHGTVNPVLVLGGAVAGGLIGPHPSMDPSNLDADGELPLTHDFRDVFGTIVDKHYGGSVAGAFPGWGPSYATMGFLP